VDIALGGGNLGMYPKHTSTQAVQDSEAAPKRTSTRAQKDFEALTALLVRDHDPAPLNSRDNQLFITQRLLRLREWLMLLVQRAILVPETHRGAVLSASATEFAASNIARFMLTAMIPLHFPQMLPSDVLHALLVVKQLKPTSHCDSIHALVLSRCIAIIGNVPPELHANHPYSALSRIEKTVLRCFYNALDMTQLPLSSYAIAYAIELSSHCADST
jgi:hypothetical protein